MLSGIPFPYLSFPSRVKICFAAALPDLAGSWLLQPRLLPADTAWGQKGTHTARGDAGGAGGKDPSCHRAPLVALSKGEKGFFAGN